MVKPSKEDGAKLAEASYFMGRKKDEFKKKKDRVARVNSWLEESGIADDYTFIPGSSNSNMSVFSRKDDPKNITIAYRGTIPSAGRRSVQDLATDAGFGFGLGQIQPDLKRRKERTNDIIRELKPTNLNIVGHSLGGIAANYVVANSKKVRRNLTSSQTYNAGFNPIFASGVTVSDKNKEKLKNKVTHYSVKGDPISFGGRGEYKSDGVPFGKAKQQEHKYEKGVLDKGAVKFVLDNTILGDLVNPVNTTVKGIHAHGLNQFYDVPPPQETKPKEE
jgi:hypothetical protein